MFLARLYIRNFRSIRECDIRFSPGKNVVVGKNNAGKSNIIKAIDIVLGETNPSYAKSENITEKDFCCWRETEDGEIRDQMADELFIWCELTRHPNERLNYEELYNDMGFSLLVKQQYSADYRRVPQTLVPLEYEHLFKPNRDPEDKHKYAWLYVNTKSIAEAPLEKHLEDKYSFAFAFRAVRDPRDGRINKDLRFLCRENDRADWVLSLNAPFRNALIQSAIIPSFRDPNSQLRATRWSWYGKLLRNLTSNHKQSQALTDAFAEVRKVSDSIFSDIKDKVVGSTLKVAFPGTDIFFQFNTDTGTELYQSCVIYVDDGFRSQLGDKGSGIQSATIIGLFNYYTRYVNTKTSALLCIEEPEIYLHPHARRVISDRLDEFLETNRNQVIVTSHSPEFLQPSAGDLTVAVVHKNSHGTEVKTIDLKRFLPLLYDNNQNELFFADKVIVCEGYDSHILKSVAQELFPGKLNEQNVSVISASGKDQIKSLVELVLKLGMKCYVFADFDYLLRDTEAERHKYPDSKAHQNVLHLPVGFFTQACTFGCQGNKVYGRLAKLRNRLKRQKEELFYLGKHSREFTDPELGAFLAEMRQNGLGLLSGEIEHCSKDPSFMTPTNKLSLRHVYELNRRVTKGKRVTDIIATDEICEFLDSVFS